MIGTVSVFAANYSFSFTPPFLGSAKYSASSVADGKFTPYVSPGGTTAATSYVLIRPPLSNITTVSNIKTNVTYGKTNFTYDTGYGGGGQSYRLMGYPSNQNFQAFSAAGSWKP